MTHNDVAPRTSRTLPARPLVARHLTPRAPEPEAVEPGLPTWRLLERPLGRILEGSR